MRYLFVLIMLLSLSWGKNITPAYELEAKGNVIDIFVDSGFLYAGTANGTLEIFDLAQKKSIESIELPKIENFLGEQMSAKIYSIDINQDRSKILIISQATNGARELYIYSIKDKKLDKIISDKQNKIIKKAKFYDNENILLGHMSSEISLFNTNTKKEAYIIQVSFSQFSDFAMNENKTEAAISCESGEIFIFDIKNGKILKTLKGANLDNVYKVDYKKGLVLGAGQDREGSVYTVSTGAFIKFKADFLIYAGAISPNGNLASYAFNEQNDIVVFNIQTHSKEFVLKGQKSTLNTILFKDDKTIISASDDKFIMVWNLQ